jgi:hypothetical protein
MATENLLNLKVHKLSKDSYESLETAGNLDSTAIYLTPDEGYVTAGQIDGTDIGKKATAEGYNTTASGDYSHAEGQFGMAFGKDAHVEGCSTNCYADITSWAGKIPENLTADALLSWHADNGFAIAKGDYSHVEGQDCLALGTSAHAEGDRCLAIGENAHAEGHYTLADGVGSHAEGGATKALATNAHAEGSNTSANNANTHAEGYHTNASGEASHAEGTYTMAYGISSHSEGGGSQVDLSAVAHTADSLSSYWKTNTQFNMAFGEYSHTEGLNTLATGKKSHAEGTHTIASGTSSHTEGHITFASGENSHAEGGSTQAFGKNSHAEGTSTVQYGNTEALQSGNINVEGLKSHWDSSYNFSLAYGEGSHVEGKNCLALAEFTHAEGFRTMADGVGSHTEGHTTTAEGESSHAEGCETATSGRYSHAEGYQTRTSGAASHAEGNNTKANMPASHAEGFLTKAEGSYSHAEGYRTTAHGTGSHAEGTSEEAVEIANKSADAIYSDWESKPFALSYGSYSHSEGTNCLALGENAHAEGFETAAIGDYSHAEGQGTTASNLAAHAEGYATTANGESSHAEGDTTSTEGYASHAEGCDTVAEGYASHAEGCETTAAGDYSHVEGVCNGAKANQHVQGHYSKNAHAYENTSAQGTAGTAFIIGNGTGDDSKWTPSNAFRITYDGTAYGLKNFQSSGADYAEYFEWQDQNLNNEDRRGYFVTMDGEQIKIAEPGDYILGIISALPAIIGNGDEDWRGRYILDEFGDFIEEDFEFDEKIIDKETKEEKIVKKTATRFKQNPDYDPTKPYIQRADRPEWDAVGMMGVLSVRDDGTCKVNGYCKVAEGGIATAAETGYRVIKRVNDHIIKVIFR